MSEQQGHLTTYYSEPEIAEFSRLEIHFIRQLADEGVINSIEMAGEERRYGAENLALLRRARRLYQDLGVNLEGIEIILRLIASIEHLQNELARFQGLDEWGERPI
jgi:DNA-binding transcriptional MerR regulator